jgi:prepilin-type N-terminal cleavage/methylation domain-containing protein
MPIVNVQKRLPRNAGMTLIEVLVACSLMGIVMAVAATNFTAMIPSFRVRGAALLVAGDLNQARMSAVKEGRQFQYLPISGGYRIQRLNDAGVWQVVKEVQIEGGNSAYPHVSFGHTGVTNDPYAVAIGSSAPTAAISFQSDGTIQNPAGVFLQATSGDEQVQQAVTMSGAGRIRVWKRSGGGWQ